MLDVAIICLALNIYFEARNEPIQGQYAVAEVTLLRAAKSGKPICVEVFDDRQFSWTLEADRLQVKNSKAWNLAQQVARVSLIKPTDYTEGATHYHSTSIKKPHWAKRLCLTRKIGRHLFYKQCPLE